MTQKLSPDLTRAVQIARRRAGLDDAAWRATLAGFDCVSTKELTAAQAHRLLAGFGAETPSRTTATTLAGPHAPLLRALWLALSDLGLVRERDDRAILAFAKRQTGLDHVRFLAAPRDVRRVVEAMTDWARREAGVDWPSEAEARAMRLPRAIATRRAVILAQRRLYPAMFGDGPDGHDLEGLDAGALDRVQAAQGRRIRGER